ncbi:hypothetical protein MO973_26560 [Paenibacillus sp. TRM 82003]|nr:hypothetical protein [Paenibacillus sp. TRM 82003]
MSEAASIQVPTRRSANASILKSSKNDDERMANEMMEFAMLELRRDAEQGRREEAARRAWRWFGRGRDEFCASCLEAELKREASVE